MIYLALVFIPPLYFLVRKKWGGFIVNSIIYGIAWLCALSIIGLWLAPFVWMFAFAHAMITFRKEQAVAHADLFATKIAEKLQESKKP